MLGPPHPHGDIDTPLKYASIYNLGIHFYYISIVINDIFNITLLFLDILIISPCGIDANHVPNDSPSIGPLYFPPNPHLY